MQRIRILSDLHIDINQKYPLSWSDKDTFTILAGDTSGNPKQAVNWINRHFKNGLLVSGNHLVYNNLDLSIQELREIYANAFPEHSSMTYLDCLTKSGIFKKEVDGILFVGSTLYTNFRLGCEDGKINTEDNMYWATKMSNDYHWALVKDERLQSIRKMYPADLKEWFDKTFLSFKKVIEENPDKPVVIITHYAPSEKCLSDYVDDYIKSSYATNLEPFIKEHKNIKLWVCGHCHKQTDFKIGNCRVVMNPRGYCYECHDKDFDKDLIVDTENWEVHHSEKNEEEKEDFRNRLNKLAVYSSFFI